MLIPVIGSTIQKKEYVYKISDPGRSANTLCLVGFNSDSQNRSLITSTNIICLKTIATKTNMMLKAVHILKNQDHEAPDPESSMLPDGFDVCIICDIGNDDPVLWPEEECM